MPMATRTIEQLERLAVLAKLPPDAVLLTEDAALYRGTAVSTWERDRALGRTPPAIKVTSRTLGYRKRDLDADIATRTEAAGSEAA
jgi:hypothetical protein